MFDRFTDKSIAVIMAAQEEARRLQQTFVGTELVLLGLLTEGTSLAAKVLIEAGVTLDRAQAQLEALISPASGPIPIEIPFTPKTRTLFEQALKEARQLSHPYVAPEHVLLSVIHDEDNVALKVIRQLNVEPSKLQSALIKAMGDRAAVPAGVGGSNQESDPRPPKTPRMSNLLKEFGTNLTDMAAAGQLDPLVGRDTEVERVMQILGRRTKNNPVLLGEPGVGKTAIAEGLAQRITSQTVPEVLADKQVISLNLSSMVAGTAFRGAFEERLNQIMDEVRDKGNIILVIDEIHTLIGAGSLYGGIDAANILKPALARGELQCIGATTLDEYRKYIERDPALERRFQPVRVGEPSASETVEILTGLRGRYEEHHQLVISNEALDAAATLSERYITDRFLPDKAIDLIDEAGSRVRLRYTMLSATRILKKDLRQVQNAKSAAVDAQDFDRANALRDQELELQAQIKAAQQAEQEDPHRPVVSADDIAQVVQAWTGIPVNQLTASESIRLQRLDSALHERVIGQDEAVSAVARAVRRARVGLQDPSRPIASFIFSGPTGVGKTELAKTLAATLFGDEEALIRVDMSEFMDPHTVSQMIGSPPGFVGHDEGGKLTEAVRRRPYSVVLFDEIEKAHPDIFNVLLQVLDDGHLTDAKGRQINFKNTVIIMTSNVGSRVIEKGGGGLGFDVSSTTGESEYNRVKALVSEELKQLYRPEFLNRLDDIIVFRQLQRVEVKQIADLLLQELAQRLAENRNITLEVTEAFQDHVVTEGFDPTYGARPLRRALTRLIEDRLAEAVLSSQVNDGDHIIFDIDDDGQIEIRQPQPALAEVLVR